MAVPFPVKQEGLPKIMYVCGLETRQILANVILPGACSASPPPPRPRPPSSAPSRCRAAPTWEVAAATGRAAPHPAALIHRHRPGLKRVGLQGISGEVADLQLCEMVDEIVIGHPERLGEERDPYGGVER